MTTQGDALTEAERTLRAIAEAATPGPWVPHARRAGIWCSDCQPGDEHWSAGVAPKGYYSPDTWLTGSRKHDKSAAIADSEFVAAFDPPTVIALIDSLGALREAVRTLADEWATAASHYAARTGGWRLTRAVEDMADKLSALVTDAPDSNDGGGS